MTKIFYFFLNHKKMSFFLVFVLFVFVVSIISIFVKQKTNNPSKFNAPTSIPQNSPILGSKIPTPAIKKAPSLQTNQLGSVTFSLPSVSFPSDITIYRAENFGIDQTQALNIAKSFSIDTSPQIINSNIYIWNSRNKTISLTTYLDSGLLIYTNSQNRGKEDPTILNVRSDDDIKRVTNNFLQKQYYLGKDLVINKILYHKGEETSIPVKDISSATSFEVTLKRQINNIPLFYQYGTSDSISIIIDPLGAVRKFSYVFLSYQSLEKRQLLSIEEAKQKIQNGEGTIVSYGDNQEVNVPPLLSTRINSVDIAYLDDNTTGFLVPIFVFTGVARSSTTASSPVIIYLPAMH